MIENLFTVLKKGGGCVQVSIEPLDDIPDLVRFQVREASPNGKAIEEYEVDCSLELDELEYLAHRILDAIAYQRKQNSKNDSNTWDTIRELSRIQKCKERGDLTENEAFYLSLHSMYRNTPELAAEEPENIRISAALARHKGDRKKAAEELGISERTLYRKMARPQ